MSFLKKNAIYAAWVVVSGLLLFISLRSHDSTTSILAQVEPQKYAISFQKPVRVKKIYVIPGQRIKKGDPLIKVERQDLLLDVEKKQNELNGTQSQRSTNIIEKKYNLDMARLEMELKSSSLDTDIKRLEFELNNEREIAKNIKNLNLLKDSSSTTSESYTEMKIALLKSEKQSLNLQYQLKLKQINELFELKQLELANTEKQIRDELALLMQEESELSQIAKQDGTVGNVYAEEDELVSAFSTLVSIYANNPTVIRALINEHQTVDINSGDKVIVESTNRPYEVEGTIKEIGSRIIEYPNRLKVNMNVMTYGRELFISIADSSDFLNGEKVFVKLNQ